MVLLKVRCHVSEDPRQNQESIFVNKRFWVFSGAWLMPFSFFLFLTKTKMNRPDYFHAAPHADCVK